MIRLLALTCALAAAWPVEHLAVAQFASRAATLFPGSRYPLRLAQGTDARFFAVGTGRIEGGAYVVGSAVPSSATLVAANASTLAVRTLRVVAPPRAPAIAVAAYDDGIVFHDPATFRSRGTLATGGAPSGVAVLGETLVATDTDGTNVTDVTVDPWHVAQTGGVPLGDDVAADAPLHAFFVTERDRDGKGALARISGGRVATVVTGTTAEGLAVDRRRQLVYVADVNDDAIAIVDARTMRRRGVIGGLPRAFSVALSPDGRRLYVVSNQGVTTLFGVPGRVTEIALGAHPHAVARSASLTFPLGVALDARDGRVFVTDEQADVVDVLDARTLAPRHAPLATCRTPWKPLLDDASGRLYVPCAGSDRIDVFDARTLARERGAPFETGGYPLAVAIVRR